MFNIPKKQHIKKGISFASHVAREQAREITRKLHTMMNLFSLFTLIYSLSLTFWVARHALTEKVCMMFKYSGIVYISTLIY